MRRTGILLAFFGIASQVFASPLPRLHKLVARQSVPSACQSQCGNLVTQVDACPDLQDQNCICAAFNGNDVAGCFTCLAQQGVVDQTTAQTIIDNIVPLCQILASGGSDLLPTATSGLASASASASAVVVDVWQPNGDPTLTQEYTLYYDGPQVTTLARAIPTYIVSGGSTVSTETVTEILSIGPNAVGEVIVGNEEDPVAVQICDIGTNSMSAVCQEGLVVSQSYVVSETTYTTDGTVVPYTVAVPEPTSTF